MKKIITFVLLLVTVNIWSINQNDISQIQNSFEKRIKKYTLKNGIRVVLFQNKLSPTIACYLKIGVGSANEPFNKAGTAHFLEHLLFKGTKIIGTKDFDKEEPILNKIRDTGEEIDRIQRTILDPLLAPERKKYLVERMTRLKKELGDLEKQAAEYIISEEDSQIFSLAGQIGYNAYTTPDVTNYQIKLPKNRLELWAYLESSRFINPVFREFYPERSVIQEERKMRFDSNPKSLLYEYFNSIAFGFSPYGKPVIGYANNIPKLTLEGTKKFFEDNYIPSRMVVTISGDIDFDETLKVVKEYFEKIPDRQVPEFPPIEYEMPAGRKIGELNASSTPYMITGWMKPSISSPDNTVYEILSRILTDGQNSRLVKKLVIDKKLAQSVSAYNGVPAEKLSNEFAIFVSAYDAGEYENIYKLINEELQNIRTNGVSDEEILRVKNKIFNDLLDTLNSNAGMADLLSYYELMKNDYNYIFKYLDEIQNITSDDIQKVIEKTFVDENNTTVWIKH